MPVSSSTMMIEDDLCFSFEELTSNSFDVSWGSFKDSTSDIDSDLASWLWPLISPSCSGFTSIIEVDLCVSILYSELITCNSPSPNSFAFEESSGVFMRCSAKHFNPETASMIEEVLSLARPGSVSILLSLEGSMMFTDIADFWDSSEAVFVFSISESKLPLKILSAASFISLTNFGTDIFWTISEL